MKRRCYHRGSSWLKLHSNAAFTTGFWSTYQRNGSWNSPLHSSPPGEYMTPSWPAVRNTFILKLSILLLPRSWGKQISIPRLREAFPPVPVYQHLLRANESPFCLQKGSFCIPFVYNRKVALNHLILENILSIYSTISICISIYFAPYAI